MKRLLIAATLALCALAGSEMQARANGGGKATFGIGLNLTFSVGYSCADSCPPNYGCGTPIPYPPCQSCQGGYPMPVYGTYPMAAYGGYPLPAYGGHAPAVVGAAAQGYAAPPHAAGSNNPGGPPPSQATSSTSGYGNYPMFGGYQPIYAAAE